MQTMRLCTRGRVLDRANRDGTGIEAELAGGKVHALEQPPFKGRIDPGARDHASAVGRALRVDALDHAAQLVAGDDASLDQQQGHRLGHRHVMGERRVLDVRLLGMRRMVMMRMVVMGVRVAHRDASSAGSSQLS